MILNTPIQINSLKLNNRLVMPPMATSKSLNGGIAGEALISYYDEKSKGGNIGLIITEHAYVSKEGEASKNQLSMAEDTDIDSLKNLTSRIHENNTKVIAQISHAGSKAKKEITGLTPISPSGLAYPQNNPDCSKMSIEDIHKVIQDFANAALRAKKAGFDGVEIHSAHGYLLNQFYSPITNKRKDEYSADTMENRVRLHTEILKAVRLKVGEDFPIFVRLGAMDFIPEGSSLQDAVEASKILAKNGADCIDISGGLLGYIRPDHKEEGYFKDISKAVKENVSVPVLVTGGIKTPEACEKLLEEKDCDLVGVGRSILVDSSWAKKAMEFAENQ